MTHLEQVGGHLMQMMIAKMLGALPLEELQIGIAHQLQQLKLKLGVVGVQNPRHLKKQANQQVLIPGQLKLLIKK